MSIIPFERSFASHEKSKYWNYEKNGDVTPRNIRIASNKMFWFTCGVCLHVVECIISSVTRQNRINWCSFCANRQLCDNDNCKSCFEKSFASHEKSKYWNKEMNGDVTPRQVFIGSGKKYWIECSDCQHSFETNISSITNKTRQKWCPFCTNHKLCDNEFCKTCFDKSFASHEKSKYWNKEKNGGLEPRQVFISSGKKYWFECSDCQHSFESVLTSITNKNYLCWCPFCANQKLCEDKNCNICFYKSFASHEKSKYWNKEKNGELAPRQVFKGTQTKYWFDCIECNQTFESAICHITKQNNSTWCPFCVNKTETKLYNFLLLHFPTIIRQFRQDWCKNINHLPFDFCILEHNIIIELDGAQHFRQVLNWKSPEDQYQIDKYKESCAYQNGYSVIRILQEDVWYDKYDWAKELIEAIERIKSYDKPTNIYLHKNNEYKHY